MTAVLHPNRQPPAIQMETLAASNSRNIRGKILNHLNAVYSSTSTIAKIAQSSLKPSTSVTDDLLA